MLQLELHTPVPEEGTGEQVFAPGCHFQNAPGLAAVLHWDPDGGLGLLLCTSKQKGTFADRASV